MQTNNAYNYREEVESKVRRAIETDKYAKVAAAYIGDGRVDKEGLADKLADLMEDDDAIINNEITESEALERLNGNLEDVARVVNQSSRLYAEDPLIPLIDYLETTEQVDRANYIDDDTGYVKVWDMLVDSGLAWELDVMVQSYYLYDVIIDVVDGLDEKERQNAEHGC